MTLDALREITAPVAGELAGISYRQLDHWARRGWVQPSIDNGLGRAGRRLYHPGDVVRLGALGHFGRSGLDVGRLGPLVAALELPLGADFLLLADAGDGTVAAVPAADLRIRVTQPSLRAVFDPGPLQVRFGLLDEPHVDGVVGRPRLSSVERSA